MKKIRVLFYFLFLSLSPSVFSQNYWQQRVEYEMTVDVDVNTYLYSGKQKLLYSNNSPDTIQKVFYHLFFNAFQKGSEMAVRIKTGKDKNYRFKIDIDTLQPSQEGFLKVFNLKQNGKKIESKVSGTILEVDLSSPIPPKGSTLLTLDFNGQVPVMVRRAGRNSADGIALSMAQWFPKMAEYDYDGWNAEPYLGREFHGVWGDYDVKISIDKDYVVAASGYIQNPIEVGHGYSAFSKKKKKGKMTWHFIAPNVHDFTWAADPDFIHDIYPGPNNVDLHFFYKDKQSNLPNWKNIQPITAELMVFFNKTIGRYPYKQYSVVQGGDGGMEYAMLTLIGRERSFESLVGVTSHELAHSWFQHALATNEMKHEWMDEGFTSYISDLAENEVLQKNLVFPHVGSYRSYMRLALSGFEQPQSTNANRYDYNMAYESTAYSKGSVFLGQLGYIIGPKNLAKTIKEYYREFKFTHPQPNDFRRVAERVSGIQLKWYLTDWTQTTNTIDYAIKKVVGVEGKTKVSLRRIGSMPMPLDVLVSFSDGEKKFFYIPIPLMRGKKQNPYSFNWEVLNDWPWAFPDFSFIINKDVDEIESIIIDPSFYMADVDRDNNVYEAAQKE
ncbi:MAG: peptidase M1 [Flavobacteriaceae bacterium]|nr:peptidase M1 [Flavobacteriaceae bacterium]|tara:strand:+ start:12550 stop:14382 length:1833 start_codon:yes stop_codon:yes gene_type:complete